MSGAFSRLSMRNFMRIPFLCTLLLAFAVPAAAQETFAPLLTENTFVFIHVDFKKTDIDTVKTEAKRMGESLLQTLGFDARSQRATLRDLDAELEKLDTMLRPVWETITRELGIQEIAWIADEKLEEQGIQFVIVAPWKGKTDADIQKLFSVMPEKEYKEAYLSVGNFLFVAYPNFAHENYSDGKNTLVEKRILTEWVKNAVPSKESLVLKALQSLKKEDELKMVIKFPRSAREEVNNTPPPPDMPEPVLNLIRFAVDKMEWAAASFSISELLSGAEMNDRHLVTVKMPSVDDARQLRKMMEEAIEATIAAARENAPPHEQGIPLLFFEFVKGYLRTWLPVVEGDTLILKMPQGGAKIPALGAGVLLLMVPTMKIDSGRDQPPVRRGW
jgi:hypothetical protein